MTPPRPAHVLVSTDAVGGVWTYVLDLAGGLRARGLGVTLAVLGPSPSAAQRAEAEAVPGLRVVDTGLALDWMTDDETQVTAAAQALAGFAADEGADLVHLNSPALAGLADFPVPVVGACHSCLATWWDAVRGGDMPAGFRRRTETLARGYAACAELLAPSRSFAEATRARYGVEPRTVLNGRAAGERRPGPKQRLALTSGRLWDEGKNLRTLDRAAARMRGEVEAAGPLQGPGGEAVECSAVRALGALSTADLSARLRRAAVFASAARYEPFGLGVLEAAQAGCALVLSDIPTFRELWDDAAVFVSPDDDAALADVLDGLLEDEAATAALGRAAAARARSFTTEAMTDATLAVYRRALGDRAPAEAAA